MAKATHRTVISEAECSCSNFHKQGRLQPEDFTSYEVQALSSQELVLSQTKNYVHIPILAFITFCILSILLNWRLPFIFQLTMPCRMKCFQMRPSFMISMVIYFLVSELLVPQQANSVFPKPLMYLPELSTILVSASTPKTKTHSVHIQYPRPRDISVETQSYKLEINIVYRYICFIELGKVTWQ